MKGKNAVKTERRNPLEPLVTRQQTETKEGIEKKEMKERAKKGGHPPLWL